MSAKDLIETTRSIVICNMEETDGSHHLEPLEKDRSELSNLSKSPTWNIGFTFPAVPMDKEYNIVLSVLAKEGRLLGRAVIPESTCRAAALAFQGVPLGKLEAGKENAAIPGVQSAWEALQSRVVDGVEEPAIPKWQMGFFHYVIGPVGSQVGHFTPDQMNPSLEQLRAMSKVSLVTDKKLLAAPSPSKERESAGEDVISLRARRQQSTQHVVERASLPDRIGHADVVEIEKLLDKGGNNQQKQIIAMLERATLSPDRLNAIYHMIDVKRLISGMNDGFIYKGRTALLQHFCLCLPILDFRTKHRLGEELWSRNRPGVELETLDTILLSLDRVSLESSVLAVPWLKAHQRIAYVISLSDKLVNTGQTGALAQPGKPGVTNDGTRLLDSIGALVLGLLPNRGVAVRLEDHELFDEYCNLLGLDRNFRDRLDLAGHRKQYPDAACFVGCIVRALKLNPILVAFLEEWERQPPSVKARAFPQQTKARDHDLTRALVYCFFLDLLTHSMMFEKPADIEPVALGQETLLEAFTRLSAAKIHQSQWWRFFDFGEHLHYAAIGHDWETDLLPFKRHPFPPYRSEEQKHEGEIWKFKLYETMFGDMLRESDTDTGFALVRGTMQKGTNALYVPDLNVVPWKESVLPPKGARATEGETCRMGYGTEAEALSPVWENLFMSWRLRACFCESDGIMMLAKLLTPLVCSFYHTKEGAGHFVTFRLPTKFIHLRFEGLSRAERQKKEPDMDWRAPHLAALWAKVNRWAAGQYLTRLDGVINKQEPKIAEALKAMAAADMVAWGKLQAGFAKHGHSHHTDNWNEQMTRLFWKICSKNHPDAVMLNYEREIFRRGERQYTGATHKTWLQEVDEKLLTQRTKDGLIDPDYYNKKLKESRTPLLEDLLFDYRGTRSEALGNQARIGTLLIDIKNVKLGHHSRPLHCVIETTLTPRDGRFQGSIHTHDNHDGVFNESFLVPLSSRVFPNGCSLVIEVWHHRDILGVVALSMQELKQYQVSALQDEAKTVLFPILPSNSHYRVGTKDTEQCDYASIGDMELSLQTLLGEADPICNYKNYTRHKESIAFRSWPANRSAAKIPAASREVLRSAMKVLLPTMKTGDLILWASSLDHGDLPTRLMNTAMNGITHSIYTHAAIVYVAEHPESKERIVLHVESGVNRLLNLDYISRTPFGDSIFVTDLAERVENDGYTMVYKPLIKPLSPEGIENISRWIAHLWLKDPPFASSQLVTAGLEKAHLKLTENTEDWNQLFCSELVSGCYKLGGVKEFRNINTSAQAPADVAAQPIFQTRRVLRMLDEHKRASIIADFEDTNSLVRLASERRLDLPPSPFHLERQETSRKLNIDQDKGEQKDS